MLNQPYFQEEAAAYAKLEEVLWNGEPACPHCGRIGKAYDIKGKTTRIGLKKCGRCLKQFTVTVGTMFESSHVPLHKWFQATYLLASSKQGISARRLQLTLEVSYKTAWIMARRIREAMQTGVS